MEYAAAIAVVFGVNLLPAFGPPTWAVLVYFRLAHDLAAVPLILGGAVAAALGRFILASATRRLRHRMSPARRASLEHAEQALAGTRGRAFAGLGLFALSPVPSAQLFVAAGMLTVPLGPLTAAFFAGRIVSYTIYVTAASAAASSIGGVFHKAVASPLGIALQVAMLVLLVVLYRVDWGRILTRHNSGTSSANTTASMAPAANASDTGSSERTSSTSK